MEESTSVDRIDPHTGRPTPVDHGRLHHRRTRSETRPEIRLEPDDDDLVLPPTSISMRPEHLEDTHPSATSDDDAYESMPTRIRARPTQPTPVTDFVAWIRAVPHAGDPARVLSTLARLRADEAVGRAALAHLRAAVSTASTTVQVFAVCAVAHLLLEQARPTLRAMCARTPGRVREPEAHFASEALRTIDHGAIFHADRVYREYEAEIREALRV